MTTLADAAIPQGGDGPSLAAVAFMVVWMLLGLGSFLFFHCNRNARLKRKVMPPFVVVVGLIFCAFVYYTTDGWLWQFVVVMIPAVILITLINIRSTRFCDACGRTLHRQPLFSRTQFCPYCGSKLPSKTW